MNVNYFVAFVPYPHSSHNFPRIVVTSAYGAHPAVLCANLCGFSFFVVTRDEIVINPFLPFGIYLYRVCRIL